MYFSSIFIQKLYRIGFILVMLLIVLDLLTYFYYPGTVFSDIFLATREQTPLTWISSLAMFFIALSCLSVYLETKGKLWYFLSATFFFFSMDDATYFHERLSGFFVDNTGFFNFFPAYTWILIYFPLLVFSLVAFIYLAWRESSAKRKKLVIIALLMLGFAIFLDLLDGFVQKNSSLVFSFDSSYNLTILHFMRLTEEVLEVFALGILGYVNIQKHCTIKEEDKK